MTSVQEVLDYVRNTYDIAPDRPFSPPTTAQVFRHPHNRKWFGILMEVAPSLLGLTGDDPAIILNVKCDPLMIGSLRREPGILPAYHMNKEHWITIVLASELPSEEIWRLIDLSYTLTL